eukprot:4348004-Prorocentrum_lima.AAC.1
MHPVKDGHRRVKRRSGKERYNGYGPARGEEEERNGGVFHPNVATEVHHYRENIGCWLLPAWAGVPLYAEASMA